MQPHVTEAEVHELVELAARSTDGLAASRKWVVSPAVCRRYLAAGASAGAPGATAVLPFLLRSARWRDEEVVDAMLEDRALVSFERSLREAMLYDVWNDASGRPLLVERVGAWDLARLTRLVDEWPEQVIRAHILVNERIRVQLDAHADGRASAAGGPAGLDERRAVLVFDLQGLGMAHLARPSLLRLFGKPDPNPKPNPDPNPNANPNPNPNPKQRLARVPDVRATERRGHAVDEA